MIALCVLMNWIGFSWSASISKRIAQVCKVLCCICNWYTVSNLLNGKSCFTFWNLNFYTIAKSICTISKWIEYRLTNYINSTLCIDMSWVFRSVTRTVSKVVINTCIIWSSVGNLNCIRWSCKSKLSMTFRDINLNGITKSLLTVSCRIKVI